MFSSIIAMSRASDSASFLFSVTRASVCAISCSKNLSCASSCALRSCTNDGFACANAKRGTMKTPIKNCMKTRIKNIKTYEQQTLLRINRRVFLLLPLCFLFRFDHLNILQRIFLAYRGRLYCFYFLFFHNRDDLVCIGNRRNAVW